MSDETKGFIQTASVFIALGFLFAMFWRGGSVREHHIELEKIRLEREKLNSTCPGFCAEGRGFPNRVRGECECVQISDWYKGPR